MENTDYFKNFFFTFEVYSKRRRDNGKKREREKTETNLHLLVHPNGQAWVGLGQHREPPAPSGASARLTGSQLLRSSAPAFPDALAGNWMKSGRAGFKGKLALQVVVFSQCSTMTAPLKHLFKTYLFGKLLNRNVTRIV